MQRMDQDILSTKGHRAVAFIDILGFTNMVKDNKQDIILQILKKFSSLNRNDTTDSTPDVINNYAVSSFSDHIVISVALDHPTKGYESPIPLKVMSEAVNKLISITVPRGILIRGGLAYGECYHEGNIVFGKALLEAIELEEKTAIYPRIILSNKIVDEWVDENWLCRVDFDGLRYISFFSPICTLYTEKLSSALKKFRDVIITNLNQHQDNTGVFAKWTWLYRYFNTILGEWKTSYPQDAELQKVSPIHLMRLPNTLNGTSTSLAISF